MHSTFWGVGGLAIAKNLLSVCDPSIPPGEFLGPSGPKLETELKMSSRGLPAPGSKKLKTELKKSRKSRKRVEIFIFRLFFNSVFNFLDPGAGRPRELIFNSVSTFGPEGPKNSSGGMGARLGGPYLALSRIDAQVGVLNRLVLNRLGGSTARQWRYSVPNPLKTSAKQKRDRGCDSQPRPRPRLNSQPQGATKVVWQSPRIYSP